MPVGYTSVEWLDANAERSYPLADFATRRDRSGAFALPDSFLLSLYFPVGAAAALDSGKFFLRRITSFAAGYGIALGYDDGSDAPPVVATATVVRATHVERNAYALIGTGDFDDSIGRVVVGRLEEIDLQPPGVFDFDYAGGALDLDGIRPTLRGVSSFAIVVAGQVSRRYYGDIQWEAGTNIRLSIPGSTQQVRIDAIDGAGLTEDCPCADVANLPPPIRSISGVAPAGDGSFTLSSGTCVDITPTANGLALTNPCASPCCGCAELEAITRELEHFGDEATTLKRFVDNLKAQMDATELVVSGSRLNEQSCLECP
jgi:hypothetical protein